MPLNPLGLYRLKLIGEIHGQTTETAFHFITRSTSTITTYAAEAQAIVNDFLASVLPAIRIWASDDWHVKSVLIVTLIPSPGVLIENRLAGGEGFQGGDSLPSFCAGLLSLRTGISGRSAHGRLYLPGVPEDLSSDSRLSGVSLGQLQDIGTALTTRYGTAGTFVNARFGVFSRRIGVTRNPGPPPRLIYNHNGFFTVSSIVARPEIATVRKRKIAQGQ